MKGFKNSKSLEFLSLEGNNLGNYLKEYVKALNECSNLKYLNLANNMIVESKSKYIKLLLYYCPNIKSLNISYNRISLSFLLDFCIS